MHQFQSVLAALGDRVSTPAPIVLIDVVEENIRRIHHSLELQPPFLEGDRSCLGRLTRPVVLSPRLDEQRLGSDWSKSMFKT